MGQKEQEISRPFKASWEEIACSGDGKIGLIQGGTQKNKNEYPSLCFNDEEKSADYFALHNAPEEYSSRVLVMKKSLGEGYSGEHDIMSVKIRVKDEGI